MVENHFSEDLYLFFPQWEGSGETNVYTGATILRQILKPRVPFTEIEVEVSHELRVEHDIIGYPHILRYAQQARHLLSTKNPRRIFPLRRFFPTKFFSLGSEIQISLSSNS